ncbi:LysR family transcriptional regulator [Mesorhizobium sp. M0808]
MSSRKSRASPERLNLKQPSVSNALRRLEVQVGRRLVERDANRFELTEVG